LDAFEKWLGQSKLGERHVRRGQSGRTTPLSMRIGQGVIAQKKNGAGFLRRRL
jgi:hypothetical protein